MQIALFVDPLKRTPQRGIAWKKELSLAAVDRDLKNLGVLAHVIVTECVILHVNAAEDDEIVAAFITELAETGIFVAHLCIQCVTVRQGGERIEWQLIGRGIAGILVGDLRACPGFYPVDQACPRIGACGGEGCKQK